MTQDVYFLAMGHEQAMKAAPHQEIKHPEISEIRVYPTSEEAAKEAASEILKLVQANPHARITFATGNTMIELYEALAKEVKEGKADFSRTTAFHLDEYYPCAANDEHSFVKYLRERVWGPLGIGKFHEINGLAQDPEAETKHYDKLLSAQPVNLAIIGTGPWSDETNSGCHIAFNESGTPFDSRTHVSQLDPLTVMRDRKERGQDTPERSLTQGIANILEAEKIILLAFGEKKGVSLHQALFGEIGTARPASALRLVGSKVTLFIDQAAASQLLPSKALVL